MTFINDYKKADIKEEYGYSGEVNEPTFLTSFSILFRTENINYIKLSI